MSDDTKPQVSDSVTDEISEEDDVQGHVMSSLSEQSLAEQSLAEQSLAEQSLAEQDLSEQD